MSDRHIKLISVLTKTMDVYVVTFLRTLTIKQSGPCKHDDSPLGLGAANCEQTYQMLQNLYLFKKRKRIIN